MRLPITFHNSKKYGTLIGEPVQFGKPFFAMNDEYEIILPKVKEKYKELLIQGKKNLRKALDKFLKEISSFAILEFNFIICLSKDLEKDVGEVTEAFLSTEYIDKRISYIKQNYRKMKKENPLEYAESFGELVSLLGLKNTYNFLRRNGIRVGITTLNRLYKVSMMPPTAKKLIEERKLLLTVAFELPMKDTEEVAEKVKGLSFNEARNVLKDLKHLY
jgi:hypothetical protein